MAAVHPASLVQSGHETVGDAGTSPRGWLLTAAAAALLVAVEAVRALFSLVYGQAESRGYEAGAGLAVLVFVTPVLVPGLVRLTGRWPVLLGLGVATLAVRLVAQIGDGPGFVMGAVLAAGAMGVVTVLVDGCLRVAGPVQTVAVAVLAMLLDTLLRALAGTWDVLWQGFWAGQPRILAAVLMVVGSVMARAAFRVDAGGLGAPGLRAVGFGLWLALLVGFGQSLAYAGSSTGWSLPKVTLLLAGADVAALGVLALLAKGLRVPVPAAVIAGVVAAVAASRMQQATGAGAALLLLVVDVLAAVLVVYALTPGKSTGGLLGMSLAWLAFALPVLTYQIHYEIALPFANRYVPAVAVLVLTALAVAGARHEVSPDDRLGLVLGVAVGVTALAAVAVAGGLALTAPAPLSDLSEPSLRVLEYNVHEAVTASGRVDVDALTRVIDDEQPDVVVMLEVGRGWALSGTIDLQAALLRRYGFHARWAPAADQQFGTLLLTRLPVRSFEVEELPVVGSNQGRSFFVARLGMVGGDLNVIGAHLQHRNSDAARAMRVAEVGHIIEAWDGAARTVLVGDLNAAPVWHELYALRDAGFTTPLELSECRWPSTASRHCVDWVFTTADIPVSQVRVRSDDAFDHYPMVVDIELG
ncbi:MAG TPA: endonuclease/exonuclease/phosphatase family protein [Acidimicrobiales bacterium]